MANTLGLPQYGVPFVDPKTGIINQSWWLFLQNLYVVVGGANGSSSNDLALSLPEDAGIEEIKFQLIRNKDEAAIFPPSTAFQFDDYAPLAPSNQNTLQDDFSNARLEAMESMVAQILIEIQALKSGTTP